MVEAARFTYPRAQWLEGTSVKMVRVEWRTTSSPIPMKLTTMVQNCARVSFWPGVEAVASRAVGHAHQAEDVRVDSGGGVGHVAEGGGPGRGGRKDRPAATAAASSAWIMRLCFIDVSP